MRPPGSLKRVKIGLAREYNGRCQPRENRVHRSNSRFKAGQAPAHRPRPERVDRTLEAELPPVCLDCGGELTNQRSIETEFLITLTHPQYAMRNGKQSNHIRPTRYTGRPNTLQTHS
jgi:hypothetical protein